jgi:hypothetical protein
MLLCSQLGRYISGGWWAWALHLHLGPAILQHKKSTASFTTASATKSPVSSATEPVVHPLQGCLLQGHTLTDTYQAVCICFDITVRWFHLQHRDRLLKQVALENHLVALHQQHQHQQACAGGSSGPAGTPVSSLSQCTTGSASMAGTLSDIGPSSNMSSSSSGNQGLSAASQNGISATSMGGVRVLEERLAPADLDAARAVLRHMWVLRALCCEIKGRLHSIWWTCHAVVLSPWIALHVMASTEAA